MIIKGSSRGGTESDVVKLARHLLARENETVVVIEGCDGPGDLQRRLSELRAITLGTRSRRSLYHASLSLSAGEAFSLGSPTKWIESVDCLERHLGMEGHQRIVVGHSKGGRRHIHVVWCRAHPETLRIASDSQSYRKHEAASRELEERWKSRHVVGVHSRPAGTPRPVAKLTHTCLQAQTRTGIQVDDVAATLQRAWDSTATGRAFKKAIEADGLFLASGRRGPVVVDAAATPHSIPRRIGGGIRAADVQRRLRDVVAALPSVEAVQKTLKSMKKSDNRREREMPKREYGCRDGRRHKIDATLLPEHRDYWIALGYEVTRAADGWQVKLSATSSLTDAGDRLTMRLTDRPPSDEEILLMIRAGKSRGWKQIHFWGDESFQRRARTLAVKNNLFAWDDISLACEEGLPKPLAAEMPRHVRDKLMPPVEPEPPSTIPSATDIPSPTQELRP